MLSLLHALSTCLLVCLLLFGSFSRFTRGSHSITRSFHAYQRDRNDDEQLMPFIAAVDLCLALLLLPRLTRSLSAFLISAAMSVGVYRRLVVQEHKDATIDVALTAVAFVCLVTSLVTGRSASSTVHEKRQ